MNEKDVDVESGDYVGIPKMGYHNCQDISNVNHHKCGIVVDCNVGCNMYHENSGIAECDVGYPGISDVVATNVGCC